MDNVRGAGRAVLTMPDDYFDGVPDYRRLAREIG
jgi:hypothetical protein